MRPRPLFKIFSVSIALSILSTGTAMASTTTTTGLTCAHMKGKDRAICEIRSTKGRPIRRQVQEKAQALIKEHTNITKNASRVKTTRQETPY